MYKKCIKRILDIVISLILIVLLIPLFIIMALITKIEFNGKVIYKQKRIGLNEKEFIMYKFKTMNDGTKKTTKISKKIRKIGLDELPQLFNVLKGDMSLIGPRPFIVGDELPSKYNKLRHTVRPGITGYAQIKGREIFTHKEKLECDDEYIKNISFILDFRVLIDTFIYIFKKIFNC